MVVCTLTARFFALSSRRRTQRKRVYIECAQGTVATLSITHVIVLIVCCFRVFSIHKTAQLKPSTIRTGTILSHTILLWCKQHAASRLFVSATTVFSLASSWIWIRNARVCLRRAGGCDRVCSQTATVLYPWQAEMLCWTACVHPPAAWPSPGAAPGRRGNGGTAACASVFVFVACVCLCVCAHEARAAAVITAAPGPGETRARPTSANNVVNIRRRANVLRRLTAGISYLVMTQTSAEKLAIFVGKFQDIEEILAVS